MTESNHETPSRVPKHLWVVGIVGLLWNAMGAFDYVMTETRNEAYMSGFTPEQLEFFYGMPGWTVACWAIAVWGGVLGCVLLLFRRCVAQWVFLASFLAMVLTTIQNYVLSDGLEVMGGVGVLVFSAVIFLVALGLWLYARAMVRAGVLR